MAMKKEKEEISDPESADYRIIQDLEEIIDLLKKIAAALGIT